MSVDGAPRTRVVRHESEGLRWESVHREPDARLRPYVHGWYTGWTEHAARPVRRREVPIPILPLIINLGAPFHLFDPRSRAADPMRVDSFVAGLADTCGVIESPRESVALQVNFTPIGACFFFASPPGPLAGHIAEPGDVFGPAGALLPERLYHAPTWEARFRMMDAFLLRRLADARPPSASVARAWRRLDETGGAIAIGALAKEIGCSRKHLVTRFRDEIGMPPKTLARILRFGRAVELLKTADEVRWSELALRCGYYDQAHLIRDFHDFAGSTPGEFLQRRLPDGGGVSGE